jgi:hypothetical protein
VEHSAKEEDRDALQVIFILPCRLRVKEVLSFKNPKVVSPNQDVEVYNKEKD